MTSRVEFGLLWARELPWPGAWGLLQLLAAGGATAWLFRQTRSGQGLRTCWLLALPCGAVGALALGFAYRFSAWISGRLQDPFGASSIGALAGTALAFGLLARRRGTPLPVALDLVAPALMLLLAAGRLGCFLAGCDAGIPSSSDWALRFPAGTATFHEHLARGLVLAKDRWSLAVHPAQLYEAIAALVIFVVCARVRKSREFSIGTAFVSTVFGYALVRICIDRLRSF